MSLHESFNRRPEVPPVPAPDRAPNWASLAERASEYAERIDRRAFALREALAGVLAIAGEEQAEQPRIGRVFIFRGTLLVPPHEAFAVLSERFRALGFTPMLQRDEREIAVLAVEGTLPDHQVKIRPWLNLLLLIVTFISTTVMGAALTGMPPGRTWDALLNGALAVLLPALRDGLPFSVTLLAILGVHEMGHYVAARRHGVKVTLPFFIPLPVTGSLGTLGAVIFIRSPLLNRRALFDVGLAGPLAGLIVALPLYLIGLTQQASVGLPQMWIEAGIRRVANPPLLQWLAGLVVDVPNLDQYVFYRHPMALAAWFGVLLTALNLLPLGQFDGGHVAYALLGRRAWSLAWMTFFTLLVMGLMGAWTAWLIWAFMGLLSGLKHPPPHDDVSPLGWKRTVLGAATAVIFALIIVPVPLYAP